MRCADPFAHPAEHGRGGRRYSLRRGRSACRTIFTWLLLGLVVCLWAPPVSLFAQATPVPADTPIVQSPLATPIPPATPTITPSPTETPTPTPTDTPEPTATPTATVAPLQVSSPLVAQSGSGPPDDTSQLWIGAAALIVLAGSAILLFAERRQRAR